MLFRSARARVGAHHRGVEALRDFLLHQTGAGAGQRRDELIELREDGLDGRRMRDDVLKLPAEADTSIILATESPPLVLYGQTSVRLEEKEYDA